MTTVLAVPSAASNAPALADELSAAGLEVLASVDCGNLVQAALSMGPDVLVVWDEPPSEPLFRALETLAAAKPHPVVVFTNDAQVESMERGLRCGVQCWVVQGYAPTRLRPLVQLAQARFQHDGELRASLAAISQRFEERKLVDRAKGILMRASQISEDEAFRLLRTASMHGNQRVGQVSRHVIDVARYAEAINRAGQLRMLSQRAVLLRALMAAGVEVQPTLPAQVLSRSDAGLSALDKLLSKPTFGDLLESVQHAWQAMKDALAAPVSVAALPALDALAERSLLAADRLVLALESAALVGSLHVINLAGRQRMLGQRVAKESLLAALLDGPLATAAQDAAARSVAEFDAGLAHLRALPLTTRDIREALDRSAQTWTALLSAARRLQHADGRQALAASAEALLALFEQLTERYERSMQLLIG